MVKERGGRKADRISLHSRELARNLQDWAELRIRLVVLRYWEAVQQNRKAIYILIAAGFMLAVSVTFLLIAAALWAGDLLESRTGGFVLVGGIMVVIGFVLCWWAVQSRVHNINKPDDVTNARYDRHESDTGAGE